MSGFSFRDQVEADIGTVFFNGMEFADTHTIDGREMTAILDGIELLEREKIQAGAHQDGLHKGRILLYVKTSEYGTKPKIGRLLILDGKTYRVADVTEEDGIYSVELEANRS